MYRHFYKYLLIIFVVFAWSVFSQETTTTDGTTTTESSTATETTSSDSSSTGTSTSDNTSSGNSATTGSDTSEEASSDNQSEEATTGNDTSTEEAAISGEDTSVRTDGSYGLGGTDPTNYPDEFASANQEDSPPAATSADETTDEGAADDSTTDDGTTGDDTSDGAVNESTELTVNQALRLEQIDTEKPDDPTEEDKLKQACTAAGTPDVIACPIYKAARSVDAIIINLTNSVLTFDSTSLWHGCWSATVPKNVAAYSTAHVRSESCGVLTGTEGAARYHDSDGKEFVVYWNNPWSGSNTFDATTQNSNYVAGYTGNQGTNVSVKAFFSYARTPSAFKAIIASDPQAWRLETGDPNSESNRSPWLSRNKNTAQAINTIVGQDHPAFMIVNGDITEFGREATRNDYHAVYDTISTPVLYGLGNHDYANNVGDCTVPGNLSSSSCAYTAVWSMGKEIVGYNSLFSKNGNFRDDYDENTSVTQSLAYSWDYGYMHFVQLQNYPTYAVSIYMYTIKKSLDWLEQDLKLAKERGKYSILNMHDYSQHFISNATAAEKERFKNLINTYRVVAIFGGHSHVYKRVNYDGGHSVYGNAVVYDSGALFKGDFLRVNFGDVCLKVEVMNGKTGVPKVVQSYQEVCYGTPSPSQDNKQSDLDLDKTPVPSVGGKRYLQ
ncbi:aegerolysin family protein [Salmonella enterica]